MGGSSRAGHDLHGHGLAGAEGFEQGEIEFIGRADNELIADNDLDVKTGDLGQAHFLPGELLG